MLGLKRKQETGGGAFTFRVSDVLDVPLRGTVLRLRVHEGQPSMVDLKVGSKLRLRGPRGGERTVRITDYAVFGGNATQERLERTRELDVLIADEDAAGNDAVEIGWTASGPVD